MSSYPKLAIRPATRAPYPRLHVTGVTKHPGRATIETFRDGRALLRIDGGDCGIFATKAKAKAAILIYHRVGGVTR